MRSYPQIPMDINVMRKLAKETRGPGNTQVLETIGMHIAHIGRSGELSTGTRYCLSSEICWDTWKNGEMGMALFKFFETFRHERRKCVAMLKFWKCVRWRKKRWEHHCSRFEIFWDVWRKWRDGHGNYQSMKPENYLGWRKKEVKLWNL